MSIMIKDNKQNNSQIMQMTIGQPLKIVTTILDQP